MIVSKEIRV